MATVRTTTTPFKEFLAITDLSDVSATTGTGTTVVFSGSPVLTTPTVADFTNSGHNHTNAAGGAQLDHGAALTALSLADDDHTIYALLAGRAANQVLYGSNAATGTLSLSATSHGTAGTIYLCATGTTAVASLSTSGIELGETYNLTWSGTKYNIRIGTSAGTAFTTAQADTIVGYNSGSQLTSGSYNTFVGTGAGAQVSTGNYSVAVGYEAMGTSGPYAPEECIAVGYRALRRSGNSTYCVAVGSNAMGANATVLTGASDDVAIGHNALFSMTSGINNVAVGFNAAYALTSGGYSVAIGKDAMKGLTASSYNVSIGYSSMSEVTASSTGNSAFGTNSLAGNASTGVNYNTAIGHNALYSCRSDNNTAVGYFSAYLVTTGASNVAVGYYALGAGTTGASNSCLGYQAGDTLTIGSYNTILGATADTSANNLNYTIALGYGATPAANNICCLGGTGAAAVAVCIGVTNVVSTEKLCVAGAILPSGDAVASMTLGNASYRWGTIYAASSTIGDLHLKSDDGKANWTLIEQESCIMMVNENTGKKYKMMMEDW